MTSSDNISTNGLELVASIQSHLFESYQKLRMAARLGGFGLWEYDIRHGVMSCDDQWHSIVGRDPNFPVRTLDAWKELIYADDRDHATEIEITAQQLIAEGRDYGISFRIVRGDGQVRWIRSAATIETDEHGAPVKASGFIVDITNVETALRQLQANVNELRTENEYLARQALIDPLTGIANRRWLDAELDRACSRARSEGRSLTVAIFDVDFFKTYNDRYGHQQGDAALKAVAGALASAAWRPYDLAARFGGEEFVMILPDTHAPEEVISRAIESVAALGLVHEYSDVSRVVTVSCGAVTSADTGRLTPGKLLRQADRCLYEAKHAGRNTYRVSYDGSE